jgi:hypothetical protein
MLTVDGGNVVSDGRTTIMHSESATNPNYFQITFYVPEHRVNPDPTTMKDFKDKLRSGNGNKDNAVPESDWQRFKPKFCASSQKPMYVTVNGAYTDHQGQVSNVTYSLYLGQNNTDDFHINRNQQLNNYITILGLTNNKDAAESEYDFNISVDHRVDVEDSGYSIAIERETLLDSHFEFRPMDITVSAGDRVVVKVNNPETNKWLRMEESGSTDAHIPGVGIRKYFTTDLVTNILANSTSIEVKAEDNVGMLDELEVLGLKDDAMKTMMSLNKAISEIDGLSPAYHIGASYFLKLKEYDGDWEALWNYHLEGLLREYLRGMPNMDELMEKLENAYWKDESDSDN